MLPVARTRPRLVVVTAMGAVSQKLPSSLFQQDTIDADTPAGAGGVGVGAPVDGDADVERQVAGAESLFALSAVNWERRSTGENDCRTADVEAVSNNAATTLVDADVADLYPELHLPGDIEADAARSVKTAKAEDYERAASCGWNSCNFVPTVADAPGVVCRSYEFIGISGALLPHLEDAVADTTPDGSVVKVEPASVVAPSVQPAVLQSKQSIHIDPAVSPPAVSASQRSAQDDAGKDSSE